MTLRKPTYEELVSFLKRIDDARFNDPNPSYVNEVFNHHPDIVNWLWYEQPNEYRSESGPMSGNSEGGK